MPSIGTAPPSLRSLQAKCAASRRWETADRDDVAREYATARLEDYIKRVVDTAPPLTDEQRSRLASLLRPAPNAGGSDAAL